MSARSRPERHAIYLIPGFFGFANLGRLRYFVHVDRFLRERCAERGVHMQIHVVHTHPTASLPARAALVIETMARTLARNEVAHLIGHSTGGVDARLAVAPGVELPTDEDVERFAGRVRSVVGVSSPHHGTPLAAALTTRGGQDLLALLSLATSYVLRFGRLPLSVLGSLAALFAAIERKPRKGTLFDDLSERLLSNFSASRRRAVARLLREVGEDQSLLLQVTPESMDLFDATVHDRRGVRYGSVVTRSRPPGVGTTLAAGFDPGAQAIHAIYAAIYRASATTPAASVPPAGAAQRRALHRAFGKLPGARASDGIVPTRSQVHGRVIAAVRGDHLDVIGHFNDPSTEPPHFDWLTTGSGFSRAHFESVWGRVLEFVLEPAVAPRRVERKTASLRRAGFAEMRRNRTART
jgi:triacylglycerol lipase